MEDKKYQDRKIRRRNPGAGQTTPTGFLNGDWKNITVYSNKTSAVNKKTLMELKFFFILFTALLMLLSFFGSMPVNCSDIEDASKYFQKGQYRKSAEIYKSYIKDHPDGSALVPALIGAGWSLYLLGHYYDACVYLTNAMKQSPPDFLGGLLPYLIATSYKNRGDSEPAVRYYQALNNSYPENPFKAESYYYLSSLYYDLSLLDKTIYFSEKYLTMNPPLNNKKKILYLLGQGYMSIKNYLQASKVIEGLLLIEKENSILKKNSWLLLSRCYRELNQVEKANQLEKAIVREYPHDTDMLSLYKSIAETAELNNKWQEAVDLYKIIIDISPAAYRSRSAFARIAWIYQNKLLDFRKANQYYFDFYHYHHDDFRAIEGLLHAARNLQTLGELDKSYALLQYFIDKYSDHEKTNFARQMMTQVWAEIPNHKINYELVGSINDVLKQYNETISPRLNFKNSIIVAPLVNKTSRLELDVYAYAMMGLLRDKLKHIDGYEVLPVERTLLGRTYFESDTSTMPADTISIYLGGIIQQNGSCTVTLIHNGKRFVLKDIKDIDKEIPFSISTELYALIYQKINESK